MTIATARTVTSCNGTTIAYDQTGTGPALILITGALGKLLRLQASSILAQHFTVIDYSRRGRGESGDIPPYAVEREIEDLEALIDAGRRHCPPLRHLLRRRPRPRNRHQTPHQSHQTRPLRAPLHHRRQPPAPARRLRPPPQRTDRRRSPGRRRRILPDRRDPPPPGMARRDEAIPDVARPGASRAHHRLRRHHHGRHHVR
ncbi:MAG: hypothetical protein U0841_26195 [Chloroflexia bacterium]